ncbi:MAG: SpoIIE family protein phosphatase [Clostridiales bacterium]|nr:SpoIIE family protein phosphatase [Clostridiales bacterium]
MKKQAGSRDENIMTIIPEYGRQRLLTYAESFRDLADLFEEEEELSDSGTIQTTEDRQDYLWHRKLQENQELLAENLKEMAHIMSEVAKETCRYRPMGERRFRQMSRILRESGISLRNFFETEHEDGHVEFSLTMKYESSKYRKLGESEHISIEDVADFISVAMNMRLCAASNTSMYLTDNYHTYYFQEEPAYHLLTGVAKAVKETEKISGDNYSFYEADTGKMMVLLSDGMGSGEKACEDSRRVIEVMESFLAAGFRMEAAVQMINGALAAAGPEQNMSTLDLCDINLYTGECGFVKAGAACTYIKRGRLVERLSAQNLPLGVFGQIQAERMDRTLQNGDYIVMMSDGVLDALSQGIGEEVLTEMIGRMDYASPGEIANQILTYCIKQSNGQIRDDMTVLVTGIWNQAEDCIL